MIRFVIFIFCFVICVGAFADIYQKRNLDGSITFSDSPGGGAQKSNLSPISISNRPKPKSAENKQSDSARKINSSVDTQYQSLKFTKSPQPMDNFYNNPNMGIHVEAVLTPELNSNDQVQLLYNGNVLVSSNEQGSQINLNALYHANERDNELINRKKPMANFSVANKNGKSLLTFTLTNLTRVNFPPGIHVWQMRVLGPEGKQIKTQSEVRQFNVHYAEERKKPVKLIISDRVFLLVKLAVHLAKQAIPPMTFIPL
jgi:hypothetical protein